MPVDDIYNKYNIDLYYTKNSAFHNDGLTSDGFVKKVINEQDTNTYGNTIQYGKRYCERLFCQAINEEDIGFSAIENYFSKLHNEDVNPKQIYKV